MTLRGTVESGKREAAGFLTVPWVVEQLRECTGIAPYPGTLNLRLTDPASLSCWQGVRTGGTGLRLRSPDPAFCDAACFPALVGGQVRGAVVVPEVEGYPPDVVEVVAETRLRDRLSLADGDEITLRFTEVDE